MQRVIIGLAFLALVSASDAPQRERLHLDLINHETCVDSAMSGGRSTWEKKIELPSEGDLELVRVRRDGTSCYQMEGDVTLHQRMTNNMQYYIMIKGKDKQADVAGEVPKKMGPLPCKDFKKDTGCEGSGSCLYCNPCSDFDDKFKDATRAALYRDGFKVGCGEELEAGVHKNLKFRFCLPNKREFADLLGVNERVLSKMLKGSGTTISATIFIFDRDVSSMVKATYHLEELHKKVKRLNDDAVLPLDDWEKLGFYRMVAVRKSGFIGCHKIHGNLRAVQMKTSSNRRFRLRN